jgi:hypothetical protein
VVCPLWKCVRHLSYCFEPSRSSPLKQRSGDSQQPLKSVNIINRSGNDSEASCKFAAVNDSRQNFFPVIRPKPKHDALYATPTKP